MSGYNPKPARRQRRAPWQRSTKPIATEGKIGSAQRAFNRRMMAEWRFRYGDRLCSAVSGLTGYLVVGHIEDRSLEPGMRTDRANVAPITWNENGAMKMSVMIRADYQKRMRAWVARDRLNRAIH